MSTPFLVLANSESSTVTSAIVRLLRESGVAIHVAHPTRVRAFAKACGYEAKTDPRDAQVLSRYGQVFPDVKITEDEFDPEREELRDILNRRRQFVAQRVQELGRLDKGTSSITIKSAKRHIAWLEKEIARLDREYRTALDRSVQLAERAALYRSVPGIGPLTAAILVAFLPELGHWDSKAISSLVGLAPWSRDSERKRGKRAIRGGRGTVRSALYLCAWSVIQHDRNFYRRLRERGARKCLRGGGYAQTTCTSECGCSHPWVPQAA